MAFHWRGAAGAAVVLATLACGGGAMIIDLKFTTWDCYEAGNYEGIEFKSEGRCQGSSTTWGCAWTQSGNDFTIDWTGPAGERETWTGEIVDQFGNEMGGITRDPVGENDFRCTRVLVGGGAP